MNYFKLVPGSTVEGDDGHLVKQQKSNLKGALQKSILKVSNTRYLKVRGIGEFTFKIVNQQIAKLLKILLFNIITISLTKQTAIKEAELIFLDPMKKLSMDPSDTLPSVTKLIIKER